MTDAGGSAGERRSRARIASVALAACLAAIPAAMVLHLIVTKSANVPFWDEWDASLDTASQTASGELGFSDLLTQHNEHRIFFTRLVVATLTVLWNWNVPAQMLVSLLLAIVQVILLVLLLRKTQPALLPWIVVPLSFLVFSLRQSESWLWGFQTQWFFASVFLLATLAILVGGDPRLSRLGWAGLTALCATFSLSSGMLVWPIVFIILGWIGYRPIRDRLIWLLVGSVSVFIFFLGYESRPQAPDVDLLGSLGGIAQYVANYLSNPFVSSITGRLDIWLIVGLGALSFGFNSVLVWHASERSMRALAPWWGLAAYAIGAALVTASGRLGLGVDQALAERYTSVALWLWVSVIVVGAMSVHHAITAPISGHWSRVTLVGNAVVLGILGFYFVLGNHAAPDSGIRQSEERCLAEFPFTRDVTCIVGLYPVQDRLVERVEILLEHDLSLFGGAETYRLASSPLLQSETPIHLAYLKGDEILWQPAGEVFSITLTIPDTGDRFAFESGMLIRDGLSRIRVGAHSDGDSVAILDLREGFLWESEVLSGDLTRFAGSLVTLTLEVAGVQGSSLGWVNPVIREME